MPPRSPRWLVFALLASVAPQLAPGCGGFAGLRFDAPVADAILVTDTTEVVARVGREHDETTITLSLDGVDLGAALGLAPPFTDAAGSVVVGSDLIDVAGFSIYTPLEGPRRVEATLSALPRGSYTLEVAALQNQSGSPVDGTRTFDVVEFLSLEGSDVPAAGLPGGPASSGPAGTLANASLGQALAAPPIATSGGQSIRSGHVEAAEALISDGGS